MKKLISILLVMVMTFTLSSAVFANQEGIIEEETLENVKGEIIELYDRNVYHDYEVLVITFDEKYTTKGENFIVHFDVYKNNSMTGTPNGYGYTSESQRVSLEIFEYEGKRYPQLFVTIPYGSNNHGYDLNKTVIRLDEGIFLTDDGEMSRKAEIPYKNFNNDNSSEKIKLTCKGDQITKVSNNAGNTDIWLLQNSTVTAEATISNSEYADVWMANSKINFYWFDTLVESENNSILVEEVGNYTVEFKLCDQVSFKKYFVSEAKTDRYFQNLGESTEVLLLSPITFVVSVILFIFVPGFGTWIGSTAAIASLYTIPNFFATLFGVNLTTEYTF